MNLTRIHGAGHRTAIAHALDCIPKPIIDRLAHVQFVCGIDPIFAGLHSYDANGIDDRSYRCTAHCLYPFHIARPAAERVTTVVTPIPASPETFVHELGHALHETLHFDPVPKPIDDYARSNKLEAFACAFTAWVSVSHHHLIDDRTRWLFEALAAGREAPALR